MRVDEFQKRPSPAAVASDDPRRETDRTGLEPEWLWRGRAPGLDGLRGISILLVVLSHVMETPGFPIRAIHALKSGGQLGVEVFFAISGFLITLLLVRELRRSGTISLRGFYTRRAFRILPAFFTYLAFVFLLTRFGMVTVGAGDWARALTYTVNFQAVPLNVLGHLWSLSVEEHFYLLWPPLLLLRGTRAGRNVALGTMLAMPASRFVCLTWFPEVFRASRCTFMKLDAISAGCLLALLAVDPTVRRRVRGLGRRWIGLVLAATAALAMAHVANTVLCRETAGNRLVFHDFIRALAICLVLALCLFRPGSLLGRLVEFRPLTTLGVLSYSLYLWQQPFLFEGAVGTRFGRWMERWPENVVLAFLAAGASYLLVESPFLRWKDRLGARTRARDGNHEPHGHAER